jgi:hypothetical protein
MKTSMQKLLEILESKILPCPDGNDYVYGLNVAHENLIYNIKNISGRDTINASYKEDEDLAKEYFEETYKK